MVLISDTYKRLSLTSTNLRVCGLQTKDRRMVFTFYNVFNDLFVDYFCRNQNGLALTAARRGINQQLAQGCYESA